MTVRTEIGTEETAVPVDRQNEAVLDDETAVSLARLGVKIEAHYNIPMDIEWAVADGKINPQTVLQGLIGLTRACCPAKSQPGQTGKVRN